MKLSFHYELFGFHLVLIACFISNMKPLKASIVMQSKEAKSLEYRSFQSAVVISIYYQNLRSKRHVLN